MKRAKQLQMCLCIGLSLLRKTKSLKKIKNKKTTPRVRRTLTKR